MTDATELATRFVAAVAAKDFDTMAACYAPDIRIWHSTDRAWQSGEENLATAKATLSAIAGFHYGDPRITATTNGFLLQASLRGKAGGNDMDVPVCLVATVRDGKITQAEEYIDQGHFPRR
jgi:ketosteroid isomerase-like protein